VAIDHGGGSLGAARVSRLPLPAVDVAAVQSDYERRVTPMRGRRFVNMRGGIVEDLFTPPERDERDVDFLIVARFVPHKGQREFLEALPAGASARLVGPSGTYDEAYQRDVLALAGERGARVDLDLSDAELVEAYRRARFTVQVPIARPGDAPELLGLTMLEAMACGSVPISPTGGPSAEFARDGETGVEYRAGDVDDLRRAMAAALADDEGRRRLADAALEESRRWTWRAAAQTLIDTAGVR
jgi:glycosyltransferase involved in cell wall biosynthesis